MFVRTRFAAIAAALIGAATVLFPVADAVATTSARPVVTGLSIHRDSTWGGRRLTIGGANFVGVSQVLFGTRDADIRAVLSSTQIVVEVPWAPVSLVDVRVRTAAGLSAITSADRFRFTLPTMDDPINGGWTAHYEQRVSANFMAKAATLGAVPVARGSRTWTPAMGLTAARRAKAWVGIPYSWAAGVRTGPSNGVCYSGDGGGGEFDCHVWGFDCSGLVLYGWGPYVGLPHFAQSQYASGAFHPITAELAPGDLLFYSDGAGGIGHVVMYIGHGQVVQAWQSGHPVQVSKVSDMAWMAGAYAGATRPMTVARGRSLTYVTGLSLHAGATGGGQWVTIAGSGFTSSTSVVIGTKVVYDYQLLSSTRIRVQMPAHSPGTVHVRVADAWGVSPTSSADLFSWVGAPAITGPARPSGVTAGGETVTFSGNNFRDVTSVTFDGAPVPRFTATSSTQLRVLTPPHAAGSVPVRVTTKYGTSRTIWFTYIDPPMVSSVSPASGPASGGQVVTITGSSFGGPAFSGPVTVSFGLVPGLNVSVTSPTTLTVVVPPGVPGDVPVVVHTRYGQSSPAATYTYTADPTP